MTLSSTEFNAFLSIYNAENGTLLVTNDDYIDDSIGAAGTDSLLNFTPQDGVSYYVRVSSADELQTGAYSVGATVAPVIESVTVGSLSTSDDTDPKVIPTFYIDDYDLTGVSSGDQVVLDEISFEFDPILQLVNKDTGDILASSRDIHISNANSRIIFTVQPESPT